MIIRTEILRCKKITNQFLKFSMKKDLSIDLVNVSDVIETVMPLASSTALAAGVSLKVEGGGAMLTILANEGALQQVLLNLLLNAIQASERGGSVTVSCEKSQDVCIHIKDEGHGIASEDMKRIFEPFFSKRKGGIGLGLFLSQIMVEIWGGKITVQSEPGVGSNFQIVCPLPEDDLK